MKTFQLPSLLFFLFLVTACEKKDNPENSVEINGVLWMTKNLDVHHYRNGDKIMYAKSKEDWAQYARDSVGAYCYLYNQASNAEKFAKLYNWYAVNDPRGLAPDGWAIPSVADFKALEEAAGGKDIAGMNLKAKHTWETSGLASKGKDKLDWEALPGGERSSLGNFYNGGDIRGKWWTNQEWDINTECTYNNCHDTLAGKSAWSFGIHYEWDWSYLAYRNKGAGFSVRCIEEQRKH